MIVNVLNGNPEIILDVTSVPADVCSPMMTAARATTPAPQARGRIFFDISCLLASSGQPFGIARVEAEICRRLLAHDDQARFCRHDPQHDMLIEVGSADVSNWLTRFGASPAPAAMASTVTGQERHPRIKRYARALLPPLLTRMLQWTWGQLRRQRMAQPRPVAPDFRSGDTYFLAAVIWNTSHIDLIRDQSQQSGMRTVLLCHDIIPVRFPSYVGKTSADTFRHAMRSFSSVADLMICVSNNTRQDLDGFIRQEGLPLPSLRTVTPGFDIAATDTGVPLAAAIDDLLQSRYILYVSTIEKRKNHDMLYKAYLLLLEQGVTDMPRLVFVGAHGWIIDDFFHDMAHDTRIHPYISVLHQVSDRELGMLYTHALFCVYPSFYEGWGLPISEGLHHGKFCLASSQGSIPEAGGDLAEYLSPYDTKAWADRIMYYAHDPVALAAREQAIRDKFRPRSWADFSADIHDLLRH